MTYRELIKTKGYDWFSRIAKGWYNEEYAIGAGIDNEVDRYGYLCDSPFYVINQLYNVAYEENESETGSTYDWLSAYPSEEEACVLKKYLMKEVE